MKQASGKILIWLIWSGITTITTINQVVSADLPLAQIQLPTGFSIEVFAEEVPGARSMAASPNGVLFVGTRGDRIYVIQDMDQDMVADRVQVLWQGLNTPNGVAFRDGSLYVAEINRILRFEDVLAHLNQPIAPMVINDTLPTDRHHGWKFIRFGPDGLLYIPVGAPCNVCLREDKRYSSILCMKPDGTDLTIFARGVRNTVGFDWHPITRELWFTDNGRDHMGDDMPPDELNRVPEPDLHFGFPFCHGGDIADPQFRQGRNCVEFQPPAVKLGPHVAALGMRFYAGKMFGSDYQNAIFIAEHGSWNRTTPIGYRITIVDPGTLTYRVFAQGWLQEDGRAWGRPVDVLVWSDGSLLVSDDRAGAIYRIYRKSITSVQPGQHQLTQWAKQKSPLR